MSEASARLTLPLMDAGQAQKEITHNEALLALDLLVQASVIAAGLDDPPAAAVPGQAWIVGAAPTGAWADHAGEVAGWTEGGWRFAAPREGMAVWCEATGTIARHRAGAWEQGVARAASLLIDGETVVGPRRGAIAAPAGGVTIDAEARAAIGQILDALRGHGLIAS